MKDNRIFLFFFSFPPRFDDYEQIRKRIPLRSKMPKVIFLLFEILISLSYIKKNNFYNVSVSRSYREDQKYIIARRKY